MRSSLILLRLMHRARFGFHDRATWDALLELVHEAQFLRLSILVASRVSRSDIGHEECLVVFVSVGLGHGGAGRLLSCHF